MKKKQEQCASACRLSKVGGEAVIEGVMMRAGDRYSVASRKEDGSITISDHSYTSIRKKHKFFNLPLIRGIVALVESFKLSFEVLTIYCKQYITSTQACAKSRHSLIRFYHYNTIMLGMITHNSPYTSIFACHHHAQVFVLIFRIKYSIWVKIGYHTMDSTLYNLISIYSIHIHHIKFTEYRMKDFQIF